MPFDALPTAVQSAAEVHDTPCKSLDRSDAVFGLDTINHAAPFHCSTSVWSAVPLEAVPTATQKSDAVQEMPVSTLLRPTPWFGLGTTDHVAPFHCWTRVPCSLGGATDCLPTAMHMVDDVQDTALSEYWGVCAGPADHVVPSHRSMTTPTATQNDADVQETPLSWFPRACTVPMPDGTSTWLHVVPFQCLAIALQSPANSDRLPTAVQSSAAMQEMSVRSLPPSSNF